jgi:hypothetical protein
MPRNRGTGLFNGFTHKQMIIARFLIGLLNYDENDSSQMVVIRQMVELVPEGSY